MATEPSPSERAMPRQEEMANEMRRSASAIREEIETNGDPTGHLANAAAGNDAIAAYIEDLECAIAAERNLSARRTAQRDEARAALARAREEGRAEGLEMACKATCPWCSEGYPRKALIDGKAGHVIEFGRMCRCPAAAIRALSSQEGSKEVPRG